MPTPTIVQFAPLSSLTHPSFWHKLTDLKLDVLKLSDDQVDIDGSYSVGKVFKDREQGRIVGMNGTLSVGEESFGKEGLKFGVGTVPAHGILKNYNTIEDFKQSNKTLLFNDFTTKIWSSILSTKSTEELNSFLVITFADLKKYKYYYWFAFPAFVAQPAWHIESLSGEEGWVNAKKNFTDSELSSIHSQLSQYHQQHSKPLTYFLVTQTIQVLPVEEYHKHINDAVNLTIGFVDPSAQPQNPGWPLRNLLAYLRVLYPGTTEKVKVLCWRDAEPPRNEELGWASIFGTLISGDGSAPSTASTTTVTPPPKPNAVGWEKNPQGKLSPRLADLSPMMDPTQLANQAVDLNLKLMRWRILPSLDLDRIAGQRCLLLGAGTLGCYVARTLMAWGVRTITLVDSAKVSFSNPVRQPLFQFEDCVNGGKPKAECAAQRLKEVWPGLNATGHNLSIPMPGHPIPSSPPSILEGVKKDVEKLEKLVDEHDVIFLLMDSRESRWLPTVLGKLKNKLVMNAALGFDTFLVMRHGSRSKEAGKTSTLGCYYCNDIVAPADSLTDRTLDQMCTVTRPGLASIASSTTVELMMSVLQHPDGIHAPAPPPNSQAQEGVTGTSVLGLIPHQLRGYLAEFRNMHIVGSAYDKCTGCSETVLNAYEKDPIGTLLEACNDPKYLERLTGLDKLYSEGEKALEDVDWVEEGEEDDF